MCASVGSFVRRSVSSADLKRRRAHAPEALVYPLEDGESVLGAELGVVGPPRVERVEPDRALQVVQGR